MFQEAEIMNEIKENGPVQGKKVSLRRLINYASRPRPTYLYNKRRYVCLSVCI